MIRILISTRMVAISGSIIVVLAASSIFFAAHAHPAATHAAKSTKKASSPTTSTGATTNLTTSNTSAADKQIAATMSAQPATDACTLLTLSVAKQLLGTGTKASTPSDTSSLQATGTSLSSCAYADGSSTVQLTIRKPTTAVGTSENAVAFGSGKPTNAVTVQGYGQSAYWDPDKSNLNVLGSNNWYIISRSSGTQTNTQAIADLLKSGF